MRQVEIQKTESGTAEAVPAAEMVDGIDHMQRLVHEVLATTGEDYSLIEVGDGTGLLLEEGGKAAFALRHHQGRFQVNSIRGKIPPNQFKGMIRASLIDALARFQRVQSGDWRVVAFSLRLGYKTTTKRVPIRGMTDAMSANATMGANGIPTANKQKSTVGQHRVPLLEVDFAMAEMSHMDPVDPLFEERGVRMGNMYKYAESGGQMRFLPRSLRRQRERSEIVIRSYYDISDDFVGRSLDGISIQDIERLAMADFEPEAIAVMLRLPFSQVAQHLEEVLEPSPEEEVDDSQPE